MSMILNGAAPVSTGSGAAPLIRLRGVSKRYGAVKALDGVSLDLYRGQVHCLAGENGAGKSTLIKVLTGAIERTSGDFAVGAEAIPLQTTPLEMRRRGIGVVYQELSLFPELTVLDNLLMGSFASHGGVLSTRHNIARAQDYLDRVGLGDLSVYAPVQDLPTATRQLVEIARVLGHRAQFVILDEPTTALSEREAADLLDRIRLLREEGLGVLYVTHRIEEMFEIGDQMTVLRDGALVDSRPVHDFTPESLVEAMVGRPVEALYPGERQPIGSSRLAVRGLAVTGFDRPINLTVAAGEIVGLAGLLGSGRTEVLRAIFGADGTHGGQVWVDGEVVDASSPSRAAGAGIGFLTEDRKESGLLPQLSIRENLAIAGYRSIATHSWLNRIKIDRYVADALDGLRVKYGDLDDPITSLSGGNQQKVLIARWLGTGAKVLLLDEPTKGVDIGAKADIYQAIAGLAKSNISFVIVSSYLPELLGLCDRIVVIKDHAVVGELPAATATEESVMHLASIDMSHAFESSDAAVSPESREGDL